MLKITKKNVEMFVDDCIKEEEKGLLELYSVVLFEVNGNLSLKLLPDKDMKRGNWEGTLILGELTRDLGNMRFKNNKIKQTDFIYKYIISNKFTIDNFYTLKMNDLYLIDTSEYAGYSEEELLREGITEEVYKLGNKNYFFVVDKHFPKEYKKLYNSKDLLIKLYSNLLSNNKEINIDMSKYFYYITVLREILKGLEKEDRNKAIKNTKVLKSLLNERLSENLSENEFKYILMASIKI